MAKAKAKAPVTPVEPETPEEETEETETEQPEGGAVEPEVHTFETHVGLDLGANGSVVYIEYKHLADPDSVKARTVTYAGTTLEHVDTDADGVWIYRKMHC